MDALDRQVGERLAVSRRRRGLPQAVFGELIGRSESWVSKVETGVIRLDSLALARRIAELLSVELTYLLGLDLPAAAGAGSPPPAAEFTIQHLLVDPGTWEELDSVKRRWFFVQAGAAALGVVEALRADHGDLAHRVAAAQAHRTRVDPGTVDRLSEVVTGLRSSYQEVSGYSLLGPAYGMLNMLTELAAGAGAERERVVSLIGQAGTLLATVFALDLEDFQAARPYLRLAMRAAQESGDTELLAFTLGGRAFHAAHGGDLRAGAAFADAAVDSARGGVHWRTRGWLLAVASEMHASGGTARQCERLLDESRVQLAHNAEEKPWLGIGTFDAAKLMAYHGGDMMRLGRHRDAQDLLESALTKLDPAMSKHLCTAHIDLAEALAHGGELEGAADHATAALEIVVRTRHAASLRRVEALHQRISPARAGRCLGEELLRLKALS